MRVTVDAMGAAKALPEAAAADYSRFPDDLMEGMGRPGRLGRRWIVATASLMVAAMLAYLWQLGRGLRVTGLSDLVFWGVYMANFIFFIGISYAGTLISAVLRLTGAEWRRPVTRIAEVITVIALLIGCAMIIIDMGRPDRLVNIVAHGRIQSPVLWDVFSITTYLVGSFLYLYVAMVPDLAFLANSPAMAARPAWLRRTYRALSLGFRGTAEQVRHLDRALAAMAVILIPVAVSAHSVVAWIFGTTLRPGWHSTIFAPYFVVGAIFSGTGAVIIAMALFRRFYRLERYITPLHFKYLGWILLTLTLAYAYFTFSEYLTSWYGGALTESRLLELLLGPTSYGFSFWVTAVLGIFLPTLLLALPGWSISRIVTASVLVVAGMWIKRYLIVVPTLLTPFLPAEAGGIAASYTPALPEWLITLGGFAALVLLFILASKLVPMVSIWEMGETDEGILERLRAVMRRTEGAERVRAPVAAAAQVAGALLLVVAATLALPGQAGAVQRRSGSAVVQQEEAGRLPTVSLVREVEGEDDMLIATVRMAGRPVEGARVEFLVRRTFGLMPLGEDVTLDDGTAAVAFPEGLSGGYEGKLEIIAMLRAPEEYAGATGLAMMAGEHLHAEAEPFPRALWAPHGPVGMIGTIIVLLAIVWGTYGFVVTRLVRIRELALED